MQNLEKMAQTHLNKLAQEIGPRPAWTEANRRAAAYIRDVFSECGVQAGMQPYPVTGWECQSFSLKLDGVELAAEANPFSPSCQVSAPLVPSMLNLPPSAPPEIE